MRGKDRFAGVETGNAHGPGDSAILLSRKLGLGEFAAQKHAGTKRKQALNLFDFDRGVKGSWALKEKALEDSLCAIAMSDMQGRITYVNQACVRLWGSEKKEELLGMPYWELLNTGELSVVREIVKAMTEKGSWEGELCGAARSGKARFVHVLSSIVTDDDCRPLQTISWFIDITDKKLAEKALRESEERYRLLAENVTDIVWTADTKLRVTYVSPSVTTHLGYTVEEAKGLTPRMMMPPAYRKAAKGLIRKVMVARGRSGSGSKLWKIETEVYRKDGSTVWLETTLDFLKDQSGNVNGIIGVSRDIGDRKSAEAALREAERRYKAIFDHRLQLVYMMDERGVILEANSSALQKFGYTSDDLGKLSLAEIVSADALKSVLGTISDLLNEGEMKAPIEVPVRTKSGDTLWTEAFAIPLERSGSHLLALAIAHDITERKRMEQALQESEQNYSALVSNLGDAVFRLREGRIDWCNNRLKEILGYKKKEMLGQPVARFIPGIYEQATGTLRDGNVIRGTVEAVRKNGTVLDLEYSISLVQGTDPVELVGIARDVTERKSMLAALKESENQYRLLFESTQDYILVVDAESMKIVLGNRRAAQLFGIESTEELIGRNVLEFVHPDDAEKVIRGFCEDVYSHSRRKRYELRTYTIDGREMQVHILGTRIEFGGRTAALLSVRDVTKLKQEEEEKKKAEAALRKSKEHYSALVESLTEAVFQFKDGKIAWCNDRVEAIYGYPGHELLGKTADFFLGPYGDRAGFLREVSKAVSKAGMYHGKTKFQKKDGNVADIEYTVSSIPGKKPVEIVAVARDVTEQVKAEEEIRQLKEELEQRVIERTIQLQAVNKELESFAYSVSHDLRAPLRNIDGFSQALLEDYEETLGDQGKDHLKRIRAASQRMGQLIDDILGLSRVTRGEMVTESVNLSRMAHAIAAELKQGDPERRVEFVIENGLLTRGDPHLLRAVLENLLGNAWKFTGKKDQAVIEFGHTIVDRRHTYFVRDNGAGFNMDYVDKLFRAFQRLHSTSEFEGTGIGLATAQRIIHRHGGTIWAEGAEGQGATFYFTLHIDEVS
ncbi:MAG: PAS domain S-box protein [Dehalococcoidia bacterium]|nr:PAS domain S-box protein [Dehalococcoidia bacterium]